MNSSLYSYQRPSLTQMSSPSSSRCFKKMQSGIGSQIKYIQTLYSGYKRGTIYKRMKRFSNQKISSNNKFILSLIMSLFLSIITVFHFRRRTLMGLCISKWQRWRSLQRIRRMISKLLFCSIRCQTHFSIMSLSILIIIQC